MIWIIGHLFAVCIGISLGLLGGGGSVLALPVLVYVMGVSPKPAIAMTLVIVGSVSLLGSIPYARRGDLNFKIAGIFGSSTVIGAYLGAKIATLPLITSGIQMVLFGISMLLAAGLMIYRSVKVKPEVSSNELTAIYYIKPACKYCWIWLMTEGLGVGILTGLVGVGGGFAIVPALVLLGNVSMRQAIGTSLLIIACNSVAGLLGYLGHVSLDWTLTASLTFLAGCGTLLGTYLAQFVSAKQLQKSFAYLLLAVAIFVLAQNYSGLQNLKKSSIYQQSNHVAIEHVIDSSFYPKLH